MSDIRLMLLDEAENLKNIKELDGLTPSKLFMVVKYDNDHYHITHPDNIDDMLNAIKFQFNMSTENKGRVLPNKIVFHNRQAIGDILMMTCAIRDFKRAFPNIEIKVQTTCMHIWDNNPYICNDEWSDIIDPKTFEKKINKEEIDLAIDYCVKKDKPLLLRIGPKYLTNKSNNSDLHFANAYRMSIEQALDITIKQGEIKPDIWFTQEEYDSKRITDKPYWVINAGEKGDWTAKTYPFDRWKTFIQTNQNIMFVQIGQENHKHQYLDFPNVINYIGKTEDRKTGIRDLFKLFLNAEGSLGLVSFHMHLSAALNKPCVVIAGAREPVSFTRYKGHRYISTDGCLECCKDKSCWSCKIESCEQIITDENNNKFPLCVDLISPQEISFNFSSYYFGGRLKFNKVIEKPKVNISKDIEFDMKGIGSANITKNDYEFIKKVIKDNDAKTLIEFGSGLSTHMLSKLVDSISTYETDEKWISEVLQYLPKNATLKKWDGKSINTDDKKFDIAFVDGPAGGNNREYSTKIASEKTDIVIIHDAGRPFEKRWQEKYLVPYFDFICNGGNRCKLWIRKRIHRIKSKPLINFIFNGRGEGGAERSTTWLMNHLSNYYNVQYICLNGRQSGWFKKHGNKNINVTDKLSEIKKDHFKTIVYVNDAVFDFDKSKYDDFLFSEAEQKIMIVNYRIGKIGAGDASWTWMFDKYIFLNSELKDNLLTRLPGINKRCHVLPPPTDLSEFHKQNVNYGGNLRIVRHSSQGDSKYPRDFNEILTILLNRIPDCTVSLMPPPSFLNNDLLNSDRVICYKRNEVTIPEFLSRGNCFWYALPKNYYDQGPKVIMEAQAVGLPVVADNHSGAKDRLDKLGFLCDINEEYFSSLEFLSKNPDSRKKIGLENKNKAEKEYNPEKWIDIILK